MPQREAREGRTFFGHPIGLGTLFFTEMWERFSFYGLRPLLILFMSAALLDGGFGFDRTQASAIVGIYAASVYLASLPGGWIADRWLGLRRAVSVGAVLITLGHLCIGLSGFAGPAVAGKVAFFGGLTLIVMGTGLLKPNISALVGDLYPEGGSRRDAGFSIYYMGINSGAFLGQLVTGFLGEKIGWHYGFGAAGFGMLLGLIVFQLYAKHTLGDLGTDIERHPDPQVQARREKGVKSLAAGIVAVIVVVFALAASGTIPINPQVIALNMTYVLVGTAVIFFAYIFAMGNLNRTERRQVLVIMVLFIAASIFWSAFEQAPTSLNLFARDFTDRTTAMGEVPATWFQSINSGFIILLAPIAAAIWLALGRRPQGDLSAPAKFTLGLVLTALGFGLMSLAANRVVGSGGTLLVSPWWLVGSYCLQSMGELCISPVGLSSMTKLSPRKYVGQMMGIWFIASSVGNLIGGLVGGRVDPEKLEQMPQLFNITTISLVVAAVILALMIKPITRMMERAA
jgi:POT family proton-dependent oligopeptide transporter